MDCQIKDLILSINACLSEMNDFIDESEYDKAKSSCSEIIENVRDFMFVIHDMKRKMED